MTPVVSGSVSLALRIVGWMVAIAAAAALLIAVEAYVVTAVT
ncbi:MAG: hypothetical protein WB239_13885 [Acidimicrobiia bacterium]